MYKNVLFKMLYVDDSGFTKHSNYIKMDKLCLLK